MLTEFKEQRLIHKRFVFQILLEVGVVGGGWLVARVCARARAGGREERSGAPQLQPRSPSCAH
jgi:hypothetical protein